MTTPSRLPDHYGPSSGANLADILERVLDKGVVIAGDIRVNLLDIELLTIKLRLVVASVDKAKEMGIDWWESDPALSSKARDKQLARENAELRERLAALENVGSLPAGRAGKPVSGRETGETREIGEAGEAGAARQGRSRRAEEERS